GVVATTVTVPSEGTGAVRADIDAVDESGAAVQSVALLHDATGAGRAAFSASGLLEAQAAALGLQRASVGEAAYQVRLARLLGGGATEQFSTGAGLAPNTTTVSGTIRYTDRANGLHPARTIKVEIRDADGTSASGSFVATTMTGADGTYAKPV